ncbi:hypothetical protein BY996DRAFT_4317919 [Phakopsora pachyrhizi]|nr:hypothetical protein BY996DRAFT_4317919 [Phakopsora pachyrhizi]
MVQPFGVTSSNRPSWHITSSFQDFGRLRYPKQIFDKHSHDDLSENDNGSERDCQTLGTEVEDSERNFSTDLFSLDDKNLARHLKRIVERCRGFNYDSIRVTARTDSLLNQTFKDMGDFKSWFDNVKDKINPKPTFMPSRFLFLLIFFKKKRFYPLPIHLSKGSEEVEQSGEEEDKRFQPSLPSPSIFSKEVKFFKSEVEVYKRRNGVDHDGKSRKSWRGDVSKDVKNDEESEEIYYRRTIFGKNVSTKENSEGLDEEDNFCNDQRISLVERVVFNDKLLILVPERSMDCLVKFEVMKTLEDEEVKELAKVDGEGGVGVGMIETEGDEGKNKFNEESFLMIKKFKISNWSRTLDDDKALVEEKDTNENTLEKEGEDGRAVTFEDLKVQDRLIKSREQGFQETLESQLTVKHLHQSCSSFTIDFFLFFVKKKN